MCLFFNTGLGDSLLCGKRRGKGIVRGHAWLKELYREGEGLSQRERQRERERERDR